MTDIRRNQLRRHSSTTVRTLQIVLCTSCIFSTTCTSTGCCTVHCRVSMSYLHTREQCLHSVFTAVKTAVQLVSQQQLYHHIARRSPSCTPCSFFSSASTSGLLPGCAIPYLLCVLPPSLSLPLLQPTAEVNSKTRPSSCIF